MATKQIRKVPSKLPAARLFLDDIDEITSIIAQLPGFGGEKVDASTIKYKLDDRICDTIEDLKKIGGKTRKFDIDFERGNLSIASYGSSFRAYASEETAREESWKAYSQIKNIFEHRATGAFNKLRNNMALSFLLIVTVWLLVIVFWRSVTTRPVYHYAGEMIFWTILGIIVFGTSVRNSVVELSYFDEAKNERSKEMRPLIWGIWGAVIGGVVGSIITVLGERLVKWLFP